MNCGCAKRREAIKRAVTQARARIKELIAGIKASREAASP